MDKLAELSTQYEMPECCRQHLWDAVEDVASVILARYTACGCIPWTGMELRANNNIVWIQAEKAESRTQQYSEFFLSVGRLWGPVTSHTHHLVTFTIHPVAPPYDIDFSRERCQEFGTLVYELYHGTPRHGERTASLPLPPQPSHMVINRYF